MLLEIRKQEKDYLLRYNTKDSDGKDTNRDKYFKKTNSAVDKMRRACSKAEANAAGAEESASAAEEMSAQASEMYSLVQELVKIINGESNDAAPEPETWNSTPEVASFNSGASVKKGPRWALF